MNFSINEIIAGGFFFEKRIKGKALSKKIIRAVSLHEKQNFLANPCGKIRLGLVTRLPSKKKLK